MVREIKMLYQFPQKLQGERDMRNIVIVSFVVLQLILSVSSCIGSEKRETVFDRKTHISESLCLEVPMVTPLCDEIKGLLKDKVDIGDGKLYVEQEGKGTPIVLVSGGPGCTHQVFHPWFSESAKFGRVIYYDQRGVGQSDYDSTCKKYTIKQAVMDLENLRKALGIEKWVVVGHSYGGFLAQCYALEHADRMLGLVLVTSDPGMPSLSIGQTREDSYITDEEKTKTASIFGNEKLSEQLQIYNAVLNGDWKRQNYYKPTCKQLARLVRYEWMPAPGFRNSILPQMQPIDLAGDFTGYKVPTVIVESSHDLTWNADKPEKFLREHPGAQSVVFEKSAHTPYSDEPQRFFKVLRQFVASVKDGRNAVGIEPDSHIVSSLQASYSINDLPWTGVGKEVLGIYDGLRKARTTNPVVWARVGLALYDGKYYEEALNAFRRINTVGNSRPSPFMRFISLVFQGQVLDLQNHRDDAVKCYRDALDIDKVHDDDRCDCPWYGFTINRQWAQERLKTPFIRK